MIFYAADIFYNRKNEWKSIIKTAMAKDFSWSVSADKYIALYKELADA